MPRFRVRPATRSADGGAEKPTSESLRHRKPATPKACDTESLRHRKPATPKACDTESLRHRKTARGGEPDCRGASNNSVGHFRGGVSPSVGREHISRGGDRACCFSGCHPPPPSRASSLTRLQKKALSNPPPSRHCHGFKKRNRPSAHGPHKISKNS
jgi:hypothetical protein